jgi:LmbE family N-acetylglucosaminyl deacetylase
LTGAGAILAAIRALPQADPRDILKGCTPVILAPHPDDEVLGCGALLAHAVEAGCAPVLVFVTDGSGSHRNSKTFPRDVLIALRQHEACAAAETLGIDLSHVHFLGLPDTAAPHDGPRLTATVISIVRIIVAYDNPVIFAPWLHDPHCDHQATFKMATRAAHILGARHFSYIVWGWTLPETQELGHVVVDGWRLCVQEKAALKARALCAYKSQTTNLIDDDPAGFRLDQDTLDAILSEDEVFLVNQ